MCKKTTANLAQPSNTHRLWLPLSQRLSLDQQDGLEANPFSLHLPHAGLALGEVLGCGSSQRMFKCKHYSRSAAAPSGTLPTATGVPQHLLRCTQGFSLQRFFQQPNSSVQEHRSHPQPLITCKRDVRSIRTSYSNPILSC